jgi:hypothetical protein
VRDEIVRDAAQHLLPQPRMAESAGDYQIGS